ncbi:hypothetical protein CL619_04680 [archaeon]|nr:hypothetical protein [archaeon]|tara:strand:+ start:901 stop:1668 length:768 start_codon:yes stop_codon:yes gene_type:complete
MAGRNSTVTERRNLGKLFDLTHDAIAAQRRLFTEQEQAYLSSCNPEMFVKLQNPNGFVSVSDGDESLCFGYKNLSVPRPDQLGNYGVFLASLMGGSGKTRLPDHWDDQMYSRVPGPELPCLLTSVLLSSQRNREFLHPTTIRIDYNSLLHKREVERFDISSGLLVRCDESEHNLDYRFQAEDGKKYTLHRQGDLVHREGVDGMQLREDEQDLCDAVTRIVANRIIPVLEAYIIGVEADISFARSGREVQSFEGMF